MEDKIGEYFEGLPRKTESNNCIDKETFVELGSLSI